MKYDSGMTHFHNDIIAALRHMLGDNSEITEKFSPNDGSPAPLRDYLKQEYGKPHTGFCGDVHYNCSPTKGLEIIFDHILNNPGDKNLTMSWSQVAKFIRDNWDKIFKKDKPKSRPLETLVRFFDEEAMTCPNWIKGKTLKYLEAVNGIHFECKAFSAEFCNLDDITRFFVQHCNCHENCLYCKDTALNSKPDKPSYKDIFLEHYPNFDVSEFDEFAESLCVACCFDDGGAACPFPDDGGCKTHWESECLLKWRDKIDEYDLETINVFLIEQPSESETAESTSETSVAVQDENTEVPAAFDYSELDGNTAKNLRDCETVIRKETAGYFTLLGAKFKEAQELLADHANGTFEKWYAAMGFKRQTVYNLIRRYEFLNSPTIGGRTEAFEALPLTLSYEVSKPDAPKELVEKTLDGDITTNAEYLKLKAELERSRDELRQFDENSATKDREYARELDEANRRAEAAKRDSEKSTAKLAAEAAKANELEQRIKELESRPVDVKVQDNSELTEELADLREENERLKNGNIKSLIIRLTLDEYDRLLDKVDDDFNLKYIIKHAKLLKL